MKFLVVGLGSIGQRHFWKLHGVLGPNIEIIACRSRGMNLKINDDMTVERDVSLEQAYKLQVFDDLNQALEDKPDAVLVTNPTSLHMSTALAAAATGCNLFIEKPLSDTLDGTNELLNLVEEQGLIAQVGYQMRFHPALNRIREMLTHGDIGRVISAQLDFGEYLPDAHRLCSKTRIRWRCCIVPHSRN